MPCGGKFYYFQGGLQCSDFKCAYSWFSGYSRTSIQACHRAVQPYAYSENILIPACMRKSREYMLTSPNVHAKYPCYRPYHFRPRTVLMNPSPLLSLSFPPSYHSYESFPTTVPMIQSSFVASRRLKEAFVNIQFLRLLSRTIG